MGGPKMGARTSKVVFIGEALGRDEARQKKPFVGSAGRELWKWSPIDRGHVSKVTNLCNFQPPRNRDPKPQEIEAEWGRLENELVSCRPDIVVTFGRLPSAYVLGRHLDMASCHGIPQRFNHYLCAGDMPCGAGVCRHAVVREFLDRCQTIVLPCYHPAAILHNTRLYGDFVSDMESLGHILDGTFVRPVPWRTHYVRASCDSFRNLLGMDTLLAIDTEYDPQTKNVICATYSSERGEGRLVYSSS